MWRGAYLCLGLVLASPMGSAHTGHDDCDPKLRQVFNYQDSGLIYDQNRKFAWTDACGAVYSTVRGTQRRSGFVDLGHEKCAQELTSLSGTATDEQGGSGRTVSITESLLHDPSRPQGEVKYHQTKTASSDSSYTAEYGFAEDLTRKAYFSTHFCNHGAPPSMAEAKLRCSLKLTFRKLESCYQIEATIENLTSESAAGVKIEVTLPGTLSFVKPSTVRGAPLITYPSQKDRTLSFGTPNNRLPSNSELKTVLYLTGEMGSSPANPTLSVTSSSPIVSCSIEGSLEI